jgi:hypothetical protein
MAGQKVKGGTGTRDYYEGPDKPFYKCEGGRLVAAPSYGNDSGFGTPQAPGLRGEGYGGSVPMGYAAPKANTDLNQFFRKGGKS